MANSSTSASAAALRAPRINEILAREHPDAHCALHFESPLELLVATILSAQTTDERVNQVTPELFAAYPSAADYARAERAEVERILRPLGFYRAKAGYLLGLGEALCAHHDGEVPADLDALVALPGVGRKTAHVVRGNAFGLPGLTIDTHFGRLARRMGLTGQEDPVKVEREIAGLLEKSEWTMFSHRMIFHGRRVCHSRRAACGACPIAYDCPSFGKAGPVDPEAAAELVSGDNRGHILAMAGINDEEETTR